MATQVVEMSSDEAKLLRGIQRVIEKQKALDEAMKKTGETSDEAGKKAEDAGGKMAKGEGLDQLKKMAVGWIGISSAIDFATAALREHNEERKRGLDSVDTLDDANRRLAQISTSAEDLQGQQNRADSLSTRYGVSRERSRQLLFAARSEGFESFADDAARFDPLISMEASATTAGQVPTLFDKKISPREATALTLAAAEASRLDFESVAKSLPTATSGAAQAGSSPEETLSMLSVAAGKFKSGDTAAERIKALGLKLSLSEEFKGKGVVDALKRFQADPKLRADFAGDSIELNEGINSLIPLLPEIESRTKMLEGERKLVGTDDDILERKLRSRLADPEFAALQKKRGAEIAKEISGEDAFAVEAGDLAVTRSNIDRKLIDSGADPIEKYTARKAADVAEAYSLSAEGVEGAAEGGRFGARTMTVPGLLRQQSDYMGDGQRVGVMESLTLPGLLKSQMQHWSELLGMNKRIAETNDAMAKGNNNAAANAQAGRHIE